MGKSVATGEKVLRCCFHISLRGSLKDSAFLSVIYKKKICGSSKIVDPEAKRQLYLQNWLIQVYLGVLLENKMFKLYMFLNNSPFRQTL